MPMSKTNTSGSASRPTFQERVTHAAKDLEEQAWRRPPGPERDSLLRRARQMTAASHMQEWLTSQGLQPPK
jgi:hypothetical protein